MNTESSVNAVGKESITFWIKETELMSLFLENVWPQNDLWEISSSYSVGGTNVSALPISAEGQGLDTLGADAVHHTHSSVALSACVW